MRNRTNELRDAIRNFGNGEFRMTDLNIQDDAHLHKRIDKLLQADEIRVVGYTKDRKTKPARLFKAHRLKEFELPNIFVSKKSEKYTKKEKVGDMSVWAKVYPEFFREPKLKGKSRIVLLGRW